MTKSSLPLQESTVPTYQSFRKDMNLKYVFLHIFLQMFNIAAPFTPDLTGNAANSLLTGGAIGQCIMDTFQVTGSGGASPVICGANDGQHSEYILRFFFTKPASHCLRDTSRSAKCHRRAAVGHWISLCVKCSGMVDSAKMAIYLYPGQYCQTICQ